MAETKAEQLKKCPFCPDGEGKLNRYKTAVECTNCGAHLRYLSVPAEAITDWNTRPLEEALAGALDLITILRDDCGKRMKEIAKETLEKYKGK